MPAVFDYSRCSVCITTDDSTQHLLFHCPTKEKVWQRVIFEFLWWLTTTITNIKEALLSLDFTSIWYCQLTGIKPYKILLISLSPHKLWLAHMRFIFDQTPIVSTAILASIRSSVHQTIGGRSMRHNSVALIADLLFSIIKSLYFHLYYHYYSYYYLYLFIYYIISQLHPPL